MKNKFMMPASDTVASIRLNSGEMFVFTTNGKIFTSSRDPNTFGDFVETYDKIITVSHDATGTVYEEFSAVYFDRQGHALGRLREKNIIVDLTGNETGDDVLDMRGFDDESVMLYIQLDTQHALVIDQNHHPYMLMLNQHNYVVTPLADFTMLPDVRINYVTYSYDQLTLISEDDQIVIELSEDGNEFNVYKIEPIEPESGDVIEFPSAEKRTLH